VRVGGERLYRKARRGEPVEGPERLVHVHRFEQVWRDGERVGLEIECSAGTYVRQLVAALGDAYCEELERTRVGPFSLTEADAERVVPLEEALTFLPELSLDLDDAERVRHGVALSATAEPASASPRSTDARSHAGPMRMTHEGRLLAVYERSEERLRALVVFAG
jgi:tRNA pseudouridine55 synthase